MSRDFGWLGAQQGFESHQLIETLPQGGDSSCNPSHSRGFAFDWAGEDLSLCAQVGLRKPLTVT